ncbi:hypothetical protein EYW49_03995 [Siculibacillus lacustris]|uniref:PepSY domain-containing protein n=1 Tax=Siculibacillus lacustris TaxID=1549641 RepID=A0A4Q9VYQ7_9HYPH|nr:hypothetical protein [Siculibacillus lacustris]TBW40353.1 hypothetical protein EYW49_03995 [Siculibacillus lacustris]
MKFMSLFAATLLAGSSVAMAQSTAPATGGTTTTPPAVTTAPPAGSSTTKTDAMVPGANSFTEAQARERIEKAGYASVSSLVKGPDGIWRGKASKAGAMVDVSIDFKGNVASM